MDICKERAKKKPNHTIYCGLRREQNCPRYPLFDDSVIRHGVTIRVGVNFIPKNPIKVLHYHKIQLRLNVSWICTPKIWDGGISIKQWKLDLKKKKKAMLQPLGSTNLVCSRRPSMRSPQHTSSHWSLGIPLVNSCWSQEDMKSALISLGEPWCSCPRIGYCNNCRYNLYHGGWDLRRITD